MSIAHRVVLAVLSANGGDPMAPVHRDALRKITDGLYAATGANGALFGFSKPWMIRVGEDRYISPHGRARLGI